MNIIEKDGTRVLIRPEGKITAATVPALETDIRAAIGQDPVELTIDCVNVLDIDSIGVGLLVATHNTLSQQGGSLVLDNTDKEILDLFRIMRLTDHFTIRPRAAG